MGSYNITHGLAIDGTHPDNHITLGAPPFSLMGIRLLKHVHLIIGLQYAANRHSWRGLPNNKKKTILLLWLQLLGLQVSAGVCILWGR